MRLKSVDLPAPFGPMRAWRWPRFTTRSTPRMISVSPNDFVRFRSSSTGTPQREPGMDAAAVPRFMLSAPDGGVLETEHRAWGGGWLLLCREEPRCEIGRASCRERVGVRA